MFTATAAGLVLLALPGQASATAIAGFEISQPDMFAGPVNDNEVLLPPDATSVAAKQIQNGSQVWAFSLQNGGSANASNPTIRVSSGLDPALFGAVDSFPITYSQPTLGPGQAIGQYWLVPSDVGGEGDLPQQYSVPARFELGFDATRDVSPLTIPKKGGDQIVTITVTPVDPEYGNTLSGLYVGLYSAGVSGVTLVSSTGPSNLDQGEQVTDATQSNILHAWGLHGAQLNKRYTFTVVLHVANAYGKPFDFRPSVRIGGSWKEGFATYTGTSATMAEPTLDGNVPGSGSIEFSASEPHVWQVGIQKGRQLLFEGTAPLGTTKYQCKKDGWQNFGYMYPPFKNQGDCVSYLAGANR